MYLLSLLKNQQKIRFKLFSHFLFMVGFFLLITSCSNLNSSNKDSLEQGEFVYFDNGNQVKVESGGVSFYLPENWDYKYQQFPDSYAHQISCWDKVGANIFVLQWIEEESELEVMVEVLKSGIKSQKPYENVVFSEKESGELFNSQTLFTDFSVEYLDLALEGRITSFNKSGYTLSILTQGEPEFFQTRTPETILSSLNVSFIPDLNFNQNSLQNQVPEGWSIYEVKDVFKIAVPPALELRDTNSVLALTMEVIGDHLTTYKKFELERPQLMFQPVGMNDLTVNLTEKYARVIIIHEKGEKGDYLKWNENLNTTKAEYDELNATLKEQIFQQFEGVNIKIVEWLPLELHSGNGHSYIKASYLRQLGDNPVVKVSGYKFFNDDEIVEITISYRLEERDVWESDLEKLVNYFEFLNKK